MKKKANRGFTLVEILVVVAIFTIIVTSISSTYVQILKLINLNKLKVLALDIANEQMEIVHNLPYADVGEISGIPNGKIPQTQSITRNGVTFTVTTTIRNVDDPFDGQIGQSPNDTAPADYKFVQFDVDLPSNSNFKTMSLVTNIAPKNLENSSTNGALFIKVFDANGNPVQGADVHIENTALNPDIIIDDVTNIEGRLDIVDVPPSLGGYRVVVTKDGYSSDQTYVEDGVANPNPSKPDATVLIQQVTQVSFAIDELSNINISTINSMCQPVGGVDLTIRGSKLIGNTPDVYKYPLTSKVTNGSGLLSVSNIEWDSYDLNVIDPSYDLVGSNPLFPLSILPGSENDVQMIVASRNSRTLLVKVKDSGTGLPVSDATVTLTKAGFVEESQTGRGFIKQSDWSGGSGQGNWSNETKYSSSDGNIDGSSVQGELRLHDSFGSYVSYGELVSSIFDMGTSTNFSQIMWKPNDQPVQSGPNSVRLQIAMSDTNTATTTWNFVGPDGTNGSYFTTSNQNIGSNGNNVRYFRYKIFLETEDQNSTPNISDILVTFTSACVPPGQAAFSGLTSGTYEITVGKAGYENQTTVIDMNQNFIDTTINLSP